MVSHPVWIPAQHFAMVPTKCPNMFSGRVEACPCPEFQNKYPNLYLEPMQYNNPNGKWLEDIPYMIINLEHDRGIYLGKDTVVAYAREEDKACNYLEINEIAELADLKKKFPTKGKSIVESDLVFSPAQVTEHRRVELKDQEITQETRERFEKLKGKYPKVFLAARILGIPTSSQCMWTQVITPQYTKNHIHYLSSITAGFNRKSKHWNVWESSKRASACGPAQ